MYGTPVGLHLFGLSLFEEHCYVLYVYWRSNTNQSTTRRDGGIGEGEFEEVECLRLTRKKIKFKVPIAVALLNYMTIGEALPLSQIFFQTGIFHGVFSICR